MGDGGEVDTVSKGRWREGCLRGTVGGRESEVHRVEGGHCALVDSLGYKGLRWGQIEGE